MARITIKVTRNIYGNWRGFVTGRDSVQIGASEFDAIAWASDRLEELPEAVLSAKSHITLAQVLAQRESIARMRRSLT